MDGSTRVTDGVPDDVALLEVRGELTIASGFQLPLEVADMLRAGSRRLVIDLSAVEFIDSSGLGLLLNVQRRVDQEEGRLVLVEPAPRVRRVFEITRLDQQMSLVSTRAAAIAMFPVLERD